MKPRSVVPLALAACAALALAAVPVAAQDEPECGTAVQPCPWVVDLGAEGFLLDEGSRLEATQGDWVVFDFQNLDEVDHTVRLDGYDLEWTVPVLEGVTTEPIELTQAGEFALVDAPSGDRATVRVFVTDPADESPILDPDQTAADGRGDGADEADTPGPALPLTALVLAAVVLLRRRA